MRDHESDNASKPEACPDCHVRIQGRFKNVSEAVASAHSGGRSSLSRPVIGIGWGTEVWLNWAWIALDHRDEARTAREADGTPTNNRELQASMISIVAAAFAIDGFAAVARELGIQPNLEQNAPRATVIWETLRVNFEISSKTQTWPPELKRLWQLRSSKPAGGLAHPRTVFGKPVPLPGSEPSPARSTYTNETASWAVRLMADVVSTCSLEALKPGLDALRPRIQGYVTYVDEYATRGLSDASWP